MISLINLKILLAKKDLSKSRKSLSKTVDLSLEQVEANIQSLVKIYEGFKKQKVNKFSDFLNLTIYLEIMDADIILLVEKYRLSMREYEKVLIARIMALTIIGFLDSINRLIGSTLKEFKANGLSEFESDFKLINKKYAKLKTDNENLLREIRNTTLAHKTLDSLYQAQYIYGIDSEKIFSLSAGIFALSKECKPTKTKVIKKIDSFIKSTC